MKIDIFEMLKLSGQVSLVTGGAGHIGSTLCHALAQLGATVIVVDLDPERSRTTAEELDGQGRHYSLDLRDRAQLTQLIEWVGSEFGRLDVLVNCAAFVGTSDIEGWGVPFPEQSVEAWEAALDLNLTVPFILSQKLAPLLVHNGGRIVNVSSIYGKYGPDMSLYEGTSMQNPAAYGASKGGLVQLTRYLSTVLAPNIRVNTISPGGIERGQPTSFQEKYRQRTPLKRMGRESDLAGALVYLASNLSEYVTGQNLMVDGGWSAW